MHYIYLIHNLVTSKLYIGQSTDTYKRFANHKACAKKGKIHPLYCSIRKHGLSNFTFDVIEGFETQQEADDAEEYLIGFFKTRDPELGYNIKPGGNVVTGWHHSEETKRRIKKKRAKQTNTRKGVPHSEETRAKLAAAKRGKPGNNTGKRYPYKPRPRKPKELNDQV